MNTPTDVLWTIADVPHTYLTHCATLGAALIYAKQMLKAGAETAHLTSTAYREYLDSPLDPRD